MLRMASPTMGTSLSATVDIHRTHEGPKAVRALLKFGDETKNWRIKNSMTLRFAAHIEESIPFQQENQWVVVPHTDIDVVDIEFYSTPTEAELTLAEKYLTTIVAFCERNNFV